MAPNLNRDEFPAQPPEDKVFCFLDATRPCAGDCMAFRTMPEENKQLDANQVHCVLLTSAERAGRGLNGLFSVLGTWYTSIKKKAADEQRQAQFSTPPGEKR